MKISFTQIKPEDSFSRYRGYLPFLTEDRRQKIARMRHDSGRLLSLAAGLLIRYEIRRQLGLADSQIELVANPHGKLSLKGYEDFHFSVSHCAGAVAFASGSSPVGVDAEPIREANLRLSQRFFTAEEHLHITQSRSPADTFYEIWTAKEAYVKMLGTGFATPISSFSVYSEEIRPLLSHAKIDGIMLAVCSADSADLEHPSDGSIERLGLEALLPDCRNI